MKTRLLGAAVALLLAVAGAMPGARADDGDLVSAYVGAYDMMTSPHPAGMFGAEYRPDWPLLWVVKPFGGGFVTTDASVYGYAGLLGDIDLGALFGGTAGRIILTPNAAIGAFGQGDAPKDLGSVLEFRSGGEITYRFDSGLRLGVTFHHMSNAGVGDKNPGAEMTSVIMVVPTKSLFGP